MPIPDYDEAAARRTADGADVPGAPDELSAVPTHCMLCGDFTPISEDEPALVVGKPWQRPHRGWLYAAHTACLTTAGETTWSCRTEG